MLLFASVLIFILFVIIFKLYRKYWKYFVFLYNYLKLKKRNKKELGAIVNKKEKIIKFLTLEIEKQ